MRIPTLFLAAGDLVALGVVTVIGFATHAESGLALLPRMLTTFVPLTVSWLLIAMLLGLFRAEIVADPRQLWKPCAAMLFAGPLAALLRAILLGTTVIPIFALVLSGTSALGLLVWRGIYWRWRSGRA